MLRGRAVSRQLKRLKRDPRRVPRQLKRRAVLQFFRALRRRVLYLLKRDQREKNWGCFEARR